VPPLAFPADLLDRPAPEGARLVALAYLERASEAIARLADPADAEALHDFRVAVRRLRSTLRAYRALVRGSVTGKQRRRLRDVGDRTNAGRDAEVQLAWLREQEERLAPRERAGLRWLIARLEARRAAEHGDAMTAVQGAFGRAARRLRAGLQEYRARVPEAGEAGAGDADAGRFGAAAAAALAAAAVRFHERLAAVRDPADAAAAHAARIAAKRVRYVLEPLAERVPGGGSLVRRLVSLQDLLGEFNDCHVLDAGVTAAAEAAGAARGRRLHEVALAGGPDAARRASRSGRDPRPGLVAVARLLRGRRRDLFARLEEEWLADGGRGFAAELEAAAAALAGVRRAPRGAASPGAAPRARPRRLRR
jgi:CHAD domain-containing protein